MLILSAELDPLKISLLQLRPVLQPYRKAVLPDHGPAKQSTECFLIKLTDKEY